MQTSSAGRTTSSPSPPSSSTQETPTTIPNVPSTSSLLSSSFQSQEVWVQPLYYLPLHGFECTCKTRHANILHQFPQDSATPPPTSSVVIITQSGSMVTQTVTSTPTTGSSALLGGQQRSSGLSGGLIAAAVIASVLGVALIGAIVWFFMRRRRRDDENEEKFGDINDDPSSPSILNRNISTHSKAGLLDRAYPPTITTRMSRVSSTNGPDMSSSDAISPVTPNSERRQSRLVMYDQRLNPHALMVIDNGSHTSLNTLDDHRDYGRMLKVC